uniref:Copper transport protein n=1 Tax=Clastoptera arizonana TaxID=38151 RepID=A0A1B6EDC6_9HEMI
MMHEAFWFGLDLKDLLFKDFTINSARGLFFLCMGLISLTILFEGLKVLQIKAKVKSLLLGKPNIFTRVSDDTELFDNTIFINQKRRLSWFIAEVGLYVIQIISGYVIMLAVMTYNAYIGLSVLLGASIGYAVFGAVLMANRIENAKLMTPCQQCINNTNIPLKEKFHMTIHHDFTKN